MSSDYQIALEGAVFYPLEDGGHLQIAGEDRLDFLQRQTTNDLNTLAAGSILTTVLTSPLARIIDVLYLFQGESAIQALTLPGRGQHTTAFLKSKVFFMDRVSIADLSHEHQQIDLHGPQAANLLQRLGLPASTDRYTLLRGKFAGVPLPLIALPGLTSPLSYRLLAPVEARQGLIHALEDAGAVQLTSSSYHTLRVEAGHPASPGELNQDYNPLEVDLGHAISMHKGCYTGQEVIARQVNYDKITRRLVRLHLDAEAAPGDFIHANGKKVGQVTSAAHSPRFGPIALAVLKRPHNQDGVQLAVENGQAHVAAQVQALTYHDPVH